MDQGGSPGSRRLNAEPVNLRVGIEQYHRRRLRVQRNPGPIGDAGDGVGVADDGRDTATGSVSTAAHSSSASLADHRVAAFVAFAGVGLSVVGTVLNQVIPGADIYGAMETASSSERAILLEQVADAQVPLVLVRSSS